jgi:hypothetical protein
MKFNEMRFYKRDDSRPRSWWCCYYTELDIEVNIQGNELEPDKKLIDYALDILQNHYNEITDLAKSRLRDWAMPTEKNYIVESIYFGKYAYGPEQGLMSGVKLTLQTEGNACEDVYGLYTINFNESRWPVGFEFSIA